jgi:hypothetical protein
MIRRAESLVSMVEQIVKPVPLAGGGAEPTAIGEDTFGMASGRSAHFEGPPLEDFLRTVIPSVCRSIYSS